MGNWKIYQCDVRKFCARYGGPPFHTCLTDPPYNLKFMNKTWDDNIAFRPETWAALAKHLLPGAFGMTFAGSRGWHRVACAIEDAGLRLHPTIFCWAFGSGFPKASRLDTQIDKAAGKMQKVVGQSPNWRESKRDREKFGSMEVRGENAGLVTEPATDLARAWAGHRYGLQALKPAVEPIIVFQKPYKGKPVDSIVKHGAGALNIEAGRIAGSPESTRFDPSVHHHEGYRMNATGKDTAAMAQTNSGRWPANFALQHHPDCRYAGVKKIKNPSVSGKEPSKPAKNVYGEYSRKAFERHADASGLEEIAAWECHPDCPVHKLDEQSGQSKPGARRIGVKRETLKAWRNMEGRDLAKSPPLAGKARAPDVYGDAGGASRFFFNSDWNAEVEEGILSADPVRYQAKAAGHASIDKLKLGGERHEGCEEFFWLKGERIDRETWMQLRAENTAHRGDKAWKPHSIAWGNIHPTQKPIKLCNWLASLLLPPEQYAPRRILVPFSGASSEMIAAGLAGWDEIVGIEREAEYTEIACARLRHWLPDAEEISC